MLFLITIQEFRCYEQVGIPITLQSYVIKILTGISGNIAGNNQHLMGKRKKLTLGLLPIYD